MKDLIRKIWRRPKGPCHTTYPAVTDRRLAQGMAVCLRCGTLHLTKPRISEYAISDVIER